jgi:hypothetical protein
MDIYCIIVKEIFFAVFTKICIIPVPIFIASGISPYSSRIRLFI